MIYRYDNICRTNCALNKVLFGALVLMLLTIFVPNSTIRRCSSVTNCTIWLDFFMIILAGILEGVSSFMKICIFAPKSENVVYIVIKIV